MEKQNAASSQAAQKSELAFTKSIDQLAELFRTSAKSLEDKIVNANKVNDDKQVATNDRITRIESITIGQRNATSDVRDSTMVVLGVIGGLVGVVGIVFAAVSFARTRPPHV